MEFGPSEGDFAFSVGGRAYGYKSEPVHDSGRMDAYGNQVVVGYRRVINPAEAAVVMRIFRLYLEGMSPKSIAHLLNAERVPPPRMKAGRKPLGWTWTTISGARKRALGILHNPLYARAAGLEPQSEGSGPRHRETCHAATARV